MQTGRNDACPCGSGKKFKNCCIGEEKRRSSRGLMFLIAAIAVIAAAGVVPQVLNRNEPQRTPAATASPSRAGKVWSVEHNHWHDAGTPSSSVPAPARPITPPPAPAQQTFTPKPQPPGPVPAGKVWSTEHGHWHDVNAQ